MKDEGLRKRGKAPKPPVLDDGFLSTLKGFDAYAKPVEDFRIRTASGATVTLISSVLIIMLIFSEFMDYVTVRVKPSLVVDVSRREKMQLNLNITFPHLPCYLLFLDVMDVSGEHQNNVDHSIFKTRIDKQGRVVQEKQKTFLGEHHADPDPEDKKVQVCGSCYSAKAPESGCCYTCKDVQDAYERMKWTLPNLADIDQVCCT